MTTIRVAKDFPNPGGRFRVMGPESGEEFRDRLAAKLRESGNEPVAVILDGVEGYGSSFLEEAFGGLIRLKLFSVEELRRRLKIVAQSPEFKIYVPEVWQYIEDEAKKHNA